MTELRKTCWAFLVVRSRCGALVWLRQPCYAGTGLRDRRLRFRRSHLHRLAPDDLPGLHLLGTGNHDAPCRSISSYTEIAMGHFPAIIAVLSGYVLVQCLSGASELGYSGIVLNKAVFRESAPQSCPSLFSSR